MTTTTTQTKAQSIAAGLRQLADAIESGALPVPYEISPSVFWTLTEEGHLDDAVSDTTARAAMAAVPGDWSKGFSGDHVVYRKSFGPHVGMEICPPREQVCRKVQVGTEHVPAVPAHEEPVFKWECGPADTGPDLATEPEPPAEFALGMSIQHPEDLR